MAAARLSCTGRIEMPKPLIAIVDCETLHTDRIRTAAESAGADARVVTKPDDILRSDKIVIPTGDSFARATRDLREKKMIEPLLEAVDRGRHVLAISLGMHLLFDDTDDSGRHTGLGVFSGSVVQFDFGDHPAAQHFNVPHQGWNRVQWTAECPLLDGLQSGEHFYFEHALHAVPRHEEDVAALANHGIDFASVVWNENLFGVEFLPERSQDAGRSILEKFVQL